MMCIKISLGFYFLKIFTIQRVPRAIIYLVLIFTAMSSFVYFISTVRPCLSKAGRAYGGKCPDEYTPFSTQYSFVNVIGDLIFSGLSILALWRIQLNRAVKLVAGSLLLLGTIGCLASIMRVAAALYAFPNVFVHPLDGSVIELLSLVESGLGISAASSITLRPLFRRHMGWFKNGSSGGTFISLRWRTQRTGLDTESLGTSQEMDLVGKQNATTRADVKMGEEDVDDPEYQAQRMHSLQTHNLV